MSLGNVSIPDKHFYSIGDACKITGTKPHILRYWESQFKLLRPARRYSGHRKYTQQEIDLIKKIKNLIIDRKFTLAGAKREINRQTHTPIKYQAASPSTADRQVSLSVLKGLKKEIDDCLSLLGPDPIEQELLTSTN